MDLFITDAKGVISRIEIWPVKMQDFLDSVVSMAVGGAQSSTPMVGDVLEILRHKVELVRMSLPTTWAGRQPIRDKGKNVKMETNDELQLIVHL